LDRKYIKLNPEKSVLNEDSILRHSLPKLILGVKFSSTSWINFVSMNDILVEYKINSRYWMVNLIGLYCYKSFGNTKSKYLMVFGTEIFVNELNTIILRWMQTLSLL